MDRVARPNGNVGRLELVSHCPGRVRIRADVFRVLPEVAEDVAARLTEELAVLRVERSPVTGSMLIAYDPVQLELATLALRLVRLAGLHGIRAEACEEIARAPQGTRVRRRLASLNEALGKLTSGSLDVRTAVPGTLAAGGLALLLFGRRRIPEWYDLTFWAFVTFVNLNPASTAGEGATHEP